MDDNRYAPPKALVEGAHAEAGPSPAIRNPNAAASWSLLFTPIFGTRLPMKNWPGRRSLTTRGVFSAGR